MNDDCNLNSHAGGGSCFNILQTGLLGHERQLRLEHVPEHIFTYSGSWGLSCLHRKVCDMIDDR